MDCKYRLLKKLMLTINRAANSSIVKQERTHLALEARSAASLVFAIPYLIGHK